MTHETDTVYPRPDAAFALAVALAFIGGCGGGELPDPVVVFPPPTSCEAVVGDAPVSDSSHTIPFFPSASDALGRKGLARVINHSAAAGKVWIEAFDDEGESYGPLTMSLDAKQTAHFNSDDLENGNSAKGLTDCTGAGQGDWRLVLTGELEIEVLSYIRTDDGFLTSMNDTAAWRNGGLRIATFGLETDPNQESLLRLVNPGETAATAVITGTDDAGNLSTGVVIVEVPPRAARMYSATELESGGAAGLDGSLGNGTGSWQLAIESRQGIAAMSLLSSPTGHLTNLSTASSSNTGGVHNVPFLPAASDPLGRMGLVRATNRSDVAGVVSIRVFDEAGREYETLTLSLGANETKHFDSDDLELGNQEKGLTGSTGAGSGAWRLALTSDLELEVLSYVTTDDGFLATTHGTVPREGLTHRVAIFGPADDIEHTSRLRLINPHEAAAQVTISGVDDRGEDATGAVSITVPARASRTLTAQDLEGGAEDSEGTLGDGEGRWQLVVESEQPVTVLNLLSSPAGYLANLSSRQTQGLTLTYDFNQGMQGFVADYADYPPAHREIYELTSDYRSLPSPLTPDSALFISGVNRSDDLFMFFKGQVGGLVPGAAYEASVGVEIASSTPYGCVGIGGAPGESVWIKAGVSEVEPLPVLEGTWLRMNIDIGNQSNGGEDAVVLGDITNSRSCEQPRQWERKSFPSQPIPASVSASADGQAWLLFGVDSGFEGRSDVYFTRTTVRFRPM